MLKKTSFYAESWNVAWRKKKIGTILEDRDTPFQVIKNSFRYWAADPFVFEHENRIYIFAELYDYIKCKGCLGYYELSNPKAKWIPVIEEEYHLSYPFIFKVENDIFLMPESGANCDLAIYKAIVFPKQWERVDTLRSGVKFGDTTPFEWKNHKYALTYDVETEHYKLKLLDLENEKNDRILEESEVECKRPAGKIFYFDNKYVRPAQDCIGGYGKGLFFYEFQITEEGIYCEKCMKTLSPQKLSFSRSLYLDGMHTYNGSEHYEVLDIKTRRFNVLNFAFRIIHKLKKRL